MKLKALLPSILLETLDKEALEIEVTGLSTNSHACQPGDLFIGMPGTRVDGGDFWPSAIAAGAVAALVSPQAAQKHPSQSDAVVIPVADMTAACAQVAAAFYGEPGKKTQFNWGNRDQWQNHHHSFSRVYSPEGPKTHGPVRDPVCPVAGI